MSDTELLTEAYLQRQVALRVAPLHAVLLASACSGYYNADGPEYGKPFEYKAVKVTPDVHFDDNGKIVVELDYKLGDHPFGGTYPVTLTYGKPSYDPNTGTITVGKCKQLPAGGAETTGEYSVIKNRTDEPLTHHIDKTVTEEQSTSTSLDKTLELSSGQTLEAGAEFGPVSAKATVSFEEHFGLAQGTVDSHTSTTSVTVADDITVDPDRTVAVVFTVSPAGQTCEMTISAAVDWGGITIDLGSGWPIFFHPSHWDQVTGKCHIVQGTKLAFDDSDSVVRFAAGTDTRCQPSFKPSLSPEAKVALKQLSDPDTRHLSFTGTRKTSAKRDASYSVQDVTGLSSDTIDDRYGNAGQSPDPPRDFYGKSFKLSPPPVPPITDPAC